MIRPLAAFRTIGAALLAVIVTAAPAQAQIILERPERRQWELGPPTVTVNWSTTAAGPVNTTWNNNSGSMTANFGNTAGTVTLVGGPERNVAGSIFTASGYVLTGDAIGMVGSGLFPTVTINTNANDATINSIIAGAFIVTGSKSRHRHPHAGWEQ